MNAPFNSWLCNLNPFTRRRKPKPEARSDFCLLDVPRRYTRKELAKATNGFSIDCLLGEGGYGSVYRAIFSSGSWAAIKVLIVDRASNLHQRSFAAELATLGNLRHRNLVPFKGWCFTRKELFLVYYYMPNKSLDTHLFFPCHKDDGGNLPWSTRCQIATDIAQGLVYLHDVAEVVHRDIKAANVLLDSDFHAHISDFGLARMINLYNSAELPYSSIFSDKTLGDGSHGYTAPECIGARAQPMPMSDVFSFGVVLFEILSAQKANNPSTGFLLVDWIHSLFSENRLLTALDPQLTRPSSEEEMLGLFYLGLQCTQLEATHRPTMSQVLRRLHDPSNIKPPRTHHIPNFYDAIIRDSMLDVRSESSSLLAEEAFQPNLEHCSALVRAPQAFLWKDLYVATRGFSDLIGRGGFAGDVYLGQMNGQRVAVKVSREDFTCRSMDFLETDMQFLGSIRHANILRLLGWSSDPTASRHALVYDYMPNGNLYDWLKNDDRGVLQWNVRFRIAKELGAALFHLHENCDTPIIHRDVKPSNVLLDSEFHARLINLGVGINASTGVDVTQYSTHGFVTKYADVYAYGIIMLQLVTGKVPHCRMCYGQLSETARMHGHNNVVPLPVDRKLKGCYNELEVKLLFGLGLLCCSLQIKDRPDMRRVLDILDFDVPLESPFSLNTSHSFRNDIFYCPTSLVTNVFAICICNDCPAVG